MAIRNRTGIAAFIAVLTLAAGCASTIEIGSHFDRTIDFTSYTTFAWIADPPYIGGEPGMRPDANVQASIEQAIRGELEALGYEFVAARDEGDFVVAYMTGSRELIREADYPTEFQGFMSWHVPGSLNVVRDSTVHTYTEGTLSVDLFDIRTGKPVWHGWAQKTVTDSDRRDPVPSIERGVRQLFATFPGAAQ